MTAIHFINLVTAYAPSINDFVAIACFAMKLRLVAHYSILKPTNK